MGVLDGDVRALFGSAMGAFYLDATLHRAPLTVAADGDVTAGADADEAVKAQYDELTEAMRAEADFTADDVAILILQDGVSAKPTTDDEITLAGARWRIKAPITSDPAQSYWLVRGQS